MNVFYHEAYLRFSDFNEDIAIEPPLDAFGNLQWDNTYGGISADLGFHVEQVSDEGFIITGCTWSYGAGYSDIWLVKVGALSLLEWGRTFGGNDEDVSYCFRQTTHF